MLVLVLGSLRLLNSILEVAEGSSNGVRGLGLWAAFDGVADIARKIIVLLL